MSKHNKNRDYTKYYKPQNEEVVENVNPVEEVVEEIEEPVVEAPEVVEDEPKVLVTTLIGAVTNCTRLNVRTAPEATADVICEIPRDSEVEIIPDDEANGFVKVVTASGVEGYCMKKYIAIR